MCGIFGNVNFGSAPLGEEDTRRLTKEIGHRGPDGIGVWTSQYASLGHARLSIIDLSENGRQPMSSTDGRYKIVYNGEVYSFMELRRELEDGGACFVSHSDTEVVLHAFARWGTDCIARLNGIFSFAIWDGKAERLYLARDRWGVKPLYYVFNNSGIVFGSEIKALVGASSKRFEIDELSLSEFMQFGVGGLGERTIFAGIQKLEAGSVMTFDRTGSVVARYWKIESVEPTGDRPEVAAQSVAGLLGAAVNRQLVSDVPVAVFLSGGIDSSAVTAFAARHYSAPLQTYAVGFDFAPGNNELPKAARVAKYFRTEHRELFLRGTDLSDVIEQLVVHHDSPFSDAANIPLFLLCRELQGTVKVVLQGDGGDEVFGGYRRYELLRRSKLWSALSRLGGGLLRYLPVPRQRKVRIARMADIWSERNESVRMALLLAQDGRKPSPKRLLGREWRERLRTVDSFARYRAIGGMLQQIEPVQRMLWTDMQILLPDIFLEKVDRSTMANGVEARVPFLDNQLTDYVLGLPAEVKMPGGRPKGLLKRALRGIVPDFVLDAPKMGFGVPYSRWLAGPLSAFARERICEGCAAREGLIDRVAVDAALNEHTAGRADHGFLLWKYLNLAIWFERYRPKLSL